MPKIDLKKLAKFLVKAKRNTYASGSEENIKSQRPDFKELEFKEGNWIYRDSYSGFFRAPGQEIVRFNGKPIWNMSYDGGMLPEFFGDVDFAIQTFKFLIKAMKMINESKPFRGPPNLKDGNWEYKMKLEGNIKNFRGTEKILFKRKIVFAQNFMGGLILDK